MSTWTKKQPKKPGWYWLRFEGYIRPVELRSQGDRGPLVVSEAGCGERWWPLSYYEGAQWSQAIKPPVSKRVKKG